MSGFWHEEHYNNGKKPNGGEGGMDKRGQEESGHLLFYISRGELGEEWKEGAQ